MKIKQNDLTALAATLKSVIEEHGIDVELQDSLLSDVLFHVASLIDEKQGSSFHESVFSLLEDVPSLVSDYLLCELKVKLERKKIEINVLNSNLTMPESLQLNLELMLGLRTLAEMNAKVDVNEKFKAINITELTFKPLDGNEESYAETFDSIGGLVKFILKTAAKWQKLQP